MTLLLFSVTISIPFFNVYSLHEEPIISGGPNSPFHFKKFVGYGYNPKIETEIRGLVIGVDSFLYLVPDPSYYNLLLPGNYLSPECNFIDTKAGKLLNHDIIGFYSDVPCPQRNNPTGEAFDELKNAYKNMGNQLKSLNELGFPLPFPKFFVNPEMANMFNDAQLFIPIIKLERPSHFYAAYKCHPEEKLVITNPWWPNDQWPEEECTNAAYSPPVDPLKGPQCKDRGGYGIGNEDCVREGDRIIVKGLYVHEHQHTMWEPEGLKEGEGGSGCLRQLYWMENGLMACWGHAELHPYKIHHVKRISSNVSENLNPDGSYTESHTVVAPMYKAYYSQTYYPNKYYHFPNNPNQIPALDPDGYKVIPAGKLVDSQKEFSMNHNFFINAPPKPEECVPNNSNCRLEVSVVTYSSDPYNENNNPVKPIYQFDLFPFNKSNPIDFIKNPNEKNGKITTTVDYERNGVNVNMFASALTVKDPLVLKGEFTLKWVPASADEYPTKLTLNPINTAKVGTPDGVAITGKLEVCNNKNSTNPTKEPTNPCRPLGGEHRITYNGTGIWNKGVSFTQPDGTFGLEMTANQVGQNWTIQAHYAGDIVKKIAPSSSNIQTFSTSTGKLYSRAL
ncbi:hypothetical protein [Candidatus Nitrosocosmicus sp. T]